MCTRVCVCVCVHKGTHMKVHGCWFHINPSTSIQFFKFQYLPTQWHSRKHGQVNISNDIFIDLHTDCLLSGSAFVLCKLACGILPCRSREFNSTVRFVSKRLYPKSHLTSQTFQEEGSTVTFTKRRPFIYSSQKGLKHIFSKMIYVQRGVQFQAQRKARAIKFYAQPQLLWLL